LHQLINYFIFQKLQKLNIKIIHKVPSQHKTEVTGSHAPKQKKLFAKYIPIKQGIYTPRENTTIRNNWEMFCKVRISFQAYFYQNISQSNTILILTALEVSFYSPHS